MPARREMRQEAHKFEASLGTQRNLVIFICFLVVLGELNLRAFCLLDRQALYHLSHAASPFTFELGSCFMPWPVLIMILPI
jgi:hypothetical protein